MFTSRRILHVVFAVTLTAAAHAQFYQPHEASIGVALTGQYTSPLTNDGNPTTTGTTTGPVFACNVVAAATVQADHQKLLGCNAQSSAIGGSSLYTTTTTDSPGVAVSFRDSPVHWAPMEFNYQFTKYSERYLPTVVSGTSAAAPVYTPTNVHEATAAFLLKRHYGRLTPYLGLGGGALAFTPATNNNTQWRGAGLIELGVDVQTDSRLGFRFGARSIMYRSPDFYNAALGDSWVSSEQPFAGVYVKF